jgi:ATP-dependent RNA helicase RhlE
MSFNSLGLSDALLKAISKRYTTLLQYKKAIPPILEGKDVLSAQTGTGKQQDSPYPYYRHYRKENT